MVISVLSVCVGVVGMFVSVVVVCGFVSFLKGDYLGVG